MLHLHLIYNPSRALKLSPKLGACAQLITKVFAAIKLLLGGLKFKENPLTSFKLLSFKGNNKIFLAHPKEKN
jgi:hypothetical protein